MITTKLFRLLVWVASLALVISACSAPVLAGQESQLPNGNPVIEQATAAPVQPDSSRYSFEGVSLVLDPAVAASASGEIVPENPGSADGPYWDINPQYSKISLAGYPLVDIFFSPVISVYPVEEYRNLSTVAGDTLDNLKDILAQKPADVDKFPFLPVVNAGQVFHSNVEYLDFQNGSGVRFLTIYAQYPAPVNNFDLFYTFQGLTEDGRNFVSIILPVNHPSLPVSPSAVTQGEMETMSRDPQYYPNMAATLSAEPGNSFSPDLGKLDALIESLIID